MNGIYEGLLERHAKHLGLAMPPAPRPIVPATPVEKSRIVLLPVNDKMFYAYWDFNKETLAKLGNKYLEGTLGLYSNDKLVKEILKPFNTNNEDTMGFYFNSFHGITPCTNYFATLDVKGIDKLVSNRIVTPRSYASCDGSFTLGQF